MKNLLKNKKLFIALMVALVIVILVPIAVFANTGDLNEVNQSPGLVGTLKFQGSTTVGPIVQQSVGPYNTFRGKTVITDDTNNIVQNGSGDGRAAAVDHWTDIGNSSGIPSGGWNTMTTLTAYAIARDGMVFILNSSVTGIHNMTLAQIGGIYTGTITYWDQITDPITSTAGPHTKIVPRARIIGSGTRAAFKDTVGNGITYANPDQDPTSGTYTGPTTENNVVYMSGQPRIDSNVDMQSAINSISATGQCGYVGLGFETGTNIIDVNIVVSGVAYAPTGPNIYSGVYPLARFLFMCIPNDYTPANETTDVMNYITWMKQLDGAGQQAVVDTGFLRLVPNQDVSNDGWVDVLDLISVGNKVGVSGPYGRADVDHNGTVNVLDLISVGNYCTIQLMSLPPGVS